MEHLRRLDDNYVFLPAASAANLVPNVVLCIPLDHTSKAERGIMKYGQPMISILQAQARALERSLQPRFRAWKQHGSWQFTGYKPQPIGVGRGRHGSALTVGGIIASHWPTTARLSRAAPGQ